MLDRTGGEEAVLAARHSAKFVRVEIQDAGGDWVDYSDYIDVDRLDRVEVAIDNNFMRHFTVQLAREIVDEDENVVSLSPLINSDIALGRGVRIYGARVALGSSPAGSDWKLELEGKLDRWEAAQDPMVLAGRDLSGMLEDRKVEDEVAYGTEDGTPVEDVIQQVIDDWADSAFTVQVDDDSPLLDTPGLVRPYKIDAGTSVREAIFLLAEKAGGHVIEYRMKEDGSGFELLLLRPDREATLPAWTFGPADYYEVNRLDSELTNVRNVWQIEYPDDETGQRETVEVNDPDSVADYGRLWARIIEEDGSQISTVEEATAMLQAAAGDTSRPDADHEIETDYFWPVQMGDLLRHSPNAVHYLANQDFAVVAIVHEWEKGTGVTRIQTRGKPSGRPHSWRKRAARKPVLDDELAILNFREIGRTATEVTYAWELGGGLESSWIHDYVEQQPYAEDRWPGENRVPDAVSFDREVTYTVQIPEQGYVRYFQVEGRTEDGSIGAVERALIFPSNIQGDFIAFMAVKVNQSDGSVEIRGWATDRARSVAYSYRSGAADGPAPTVTDAENQGGGGDGGDLITGFTSDFYATLPADTVGYGETIKVTAVAYINADGTGADGTAQDHGPPVGAQDERIKLTSSDQIDDGIVISRKLRDAAKSFNTNIRFSATDWDTVAWTSGTLALADGTTYSILSGNTGNLSSDAPRYVYFDRGISTTTLQITTAYGSAVGEDAIILAVVQRASGGASSGQDAFYVPAVGIFGINADVIGANSITTTKITDDAITTPKIVAGAITAGKIAANTITAAQIAAGTITGNEIAANTITAAKLNVANLAAISADLGTVTAGTISAGIIVASGSFTAATATFDGSVQVEAGTGNLRIHLSTEGGDGGSVKVYNGSGDFSGAMFGSASQNLSVYASNDLTLGAITGTVFVGASGDTVGFYGSGGSTKQTGVAVTAAGIHAALVNLGLIT